MQLFYTYSTDGGVTWAANLAVSNPFNPQAGFPQNEKIGDYITIVSNATGGNVAYAATFNVNPNAVGGHEQDVYYVRVFPTGGGTPTPTPTASPTPEHSAHSPSSSRSPHATVATRTSPQRSRYTQLRVQYSNKTTQKVSRESGALRFSEPRPRASRGIQIGESPLACLLSVVK